ncbi:hypothetical protein ABLG96_13925 [Nakamurella sp. A5-74]|uniref:Uncharacterized protein n=1 Tax=Nakamurella sp. A5-74 TaxID=3158264 RepID=A0AAU8DMB1_9ACTN
MGTKMKVRELTALVAREQLNPEFRAILREFREAGHVDDQGSIALVAADMDELVYDVFRRSERAGTNVVFVVRDDAGLLHLQAMVRTEERVVVASGRRVHSMPLGTSVRAWFEQLESAQLDESWSAAGVADTVPQEFTVRSERAYALA